jgi:hypothetical protein
MQTKHICMQQEKCLKRVSNGYTEITGNNNNRATGIAYLIQNPRLG